MLTAYGTLPARRLRISAAPLLVAIALVTGDLGAQQPRDSTTHPAPRAGSGSPAPPTASASADSGVVLSFQDADLRLVISSLADMARVPVSYSALPAKPVTLRSAVPVPRAQLRSILEAVVRANGLTISDENGLLRISTPAADAPQLRAPAPDQTEQRPAASVVRLYVYRLRHARADEAAKTLRELFGQTSGRSSTLPGLPSQRSSMEREQRRERLQNPLAPLPSSAPADSSGARLTGLNAELRGAVQIVPDPLTNSLLIRSTSDDFDVLKAAIDELDVRPLQVLIEVLIAEVRRERQMDVGLNVTVPDQEEPRTGGRIGGEITGGTTGDIALRVLGIGKVKADVVLHALASSSEIRVLSRPILLAQNNQEARILVGTQRPFVQVSRALPTDGAVRDQVIQYRDVGTQLNITPTINPDGFVTLSLSQEVSSATTETQFGAPVISTREVQTQLFIGDGSTAVIGGLLDRSRETGNSGIPLLRDIPLLGNLFRSSHRLSSTTELFVLLTPHVVHTDQDLEDVTNEIRDRSQTLRQGSEQTEPLVRRPPDELRNPRKP